MTFRRSLTVAWCITALVIAGVALNSRADQHQHLTVTSPPVTGVLPPADLSWDFTMVTTAVDTAQRQAFVDGAARAEADAAAFGALVDQAITAAQAAQRAAEVARNNPSPSPMVSAYPSLAAGDCANPVVPAAVAMRESGCDWNAYNPTGCSGRGCVGFYQLDEGHFAAVSPWNPNVSGACYGLDPSTPDGQTACAERLGPGAWS